jgi:hypothetical protein
MNNTSFLVRLRKLLKQDSRYKAFRVVAKRAVDPQFETWLEEVIKLHKARSVRLLSSKSGARKLSEAGLQDQSYRSRCVEILLLITRSRNYLASALFGLQRYVESEYQSELSKMGVRTKTGQRALINLLTQSAQANIDHMDSLLEMVNLVIEDIDKAAWTVKNALAALEIATKREHAT